MFLQVEPDWLAFVLAVLWAIVYFIVKPVLNLITLPVKFLTLGFSSIVINALLLYFMQKFISNVEIVGNYISYIVLAVFISVVTVFADLLKRFIFKK